MTSWKTLLTRVLNHTGDTFEELEITLTPEELEQEFDNDYGMPEGLPFTAWSKDYVYFPAQYDGSEWVDYVPRNPCKIKTNHIGRE